MKKSSLLKGGLSHVEGWGVPAAHKKTCLAIRILCYRYSLAQPFDSRAKKSNLDKAKNDRNVKNGQTITAAHKKLLDINTYLKLS